MKHKVSEIKLKNGLKGLFVHIPDATVMTYEINFRAGEYLSIKDKYETAHLLEHILLGANERYRRSRDFQAEVEKNGAYSNASTGVYDITYEFECADFEWQRILELALLSISKPLFLDDEYKAEMGNVKEELILRSNNHFRHLGLALRENNGLIAMTDQKRLDKLQNVSIDDIRDHYLETHTTDNLRFVFAGKITKERQDKIELLLKNLPLPKKDGRRQLPKEVPKSAVKSAPKSNKEPSDFVDFATPDMQVYSVSKRGVRFATLKDQRMRAEINVRKKELQFRRPKDRDLLKRIKQFEKMRGRKI